MRVFFSIRYDTIRYEGLKEDLLFEEFSANFQNFRRFFGIFGAVVVVDDFGSWVFIYPLFEYGMWFLITLVKASLKPRFLKCVTVICIDSQKPKA